MTTVYVDTNIFLDFYRRSGNSLAVFHELQKLGQRLLFTEQTIVEFERNRSAGLKAALGLLSTIKLPWNAPPELIGGLSEFTELDRARKQVDQLVEKMKRKIDDYAKDDANDPVLTEFRALIECARSLATTSENIERAQRRKLLGHPPWSPDKITIGDELIWETLLDGCADDLILCSRDNTFVTHEPFLRAEYLRKTGKKLLVVPELSLALKTAGQDDSQVKKEEQALADQQEQAERSTAAAYAEVQRALNAMPRDAWTMHSMHLTGIDLGGLKALREQLAASSAVSGLKSFNAQLAGGGAFNVAKTINERLVASNAMAGLKSLNEQLAGSAAIASIKSFNDQLAASVDIKAIRSLNEQIAASSETLGLKSLAGSAIEGLKTLNEQLASSATVAGLKALNERLAGSIDLSGLKALDEQLAGSAAMKGLKAFGEQLMRSPELTALKSLNEQFASNSAIATLKSLNDRFVGSVDLQALKSLREQFAASTAVATLKSVNDRFVRNLEPDTPEETTAEDSDENVNDASADDEDTAH